MSRMKVDDVFDSYNGDTDSEPSNTPKQCKFCGKRNLQWEDDNGKWVLVDSHTGEIHRCLKPKKLDIDKLLNGKI